MADGQKISERILIDTLIGNEKIPLGVAGNKAATPALLRTYLLLTGVDTAALRDEAIAALETTLLGGVASPGDNLKKLYDLIVALEASKLDASAYSQHFKGVFTSESAMNAYYLPSELEAGDYAQVNEVGAPSVRNFSWDVEAELWIEGGSGGSGATNTDMLPEGSTNFYFTAARVLATVITGFSSGAGTVVSTDTLLEAINKIVGNIALKESISNKGNANGYAGLNSSSEVPSAQLPVTITDIAFVLNTVKDQDLWLIASTITQVTKTAGISTVEYRKNGGAYVALTFSGNTWSGTISVAANDVFDWRITYSGGYTSGDILIVSKRTV